MITAHVPLAWDTSRIRNSPSVSVLGNCKPGDGAARTRASPMKYLTPLPDLKGVEGNFGMHDLVLSSRKIQ
jgi:hypothetical protein